MGYLSIVNMSFPYKYYHCSLLCSCDSLTHQTRSLNLRWNSNSNATQSVQTIMKMLSTTPCDFQYGKCSIFRVQTNSVGQQEQTHIRATCYEILGCSVGYLTLIPHYAVNKYNNILYLQKWQMNIVSKNAWRQILKLVFVKSPFTRKHIKVPI